MLSVQPVLRIRYWSCFYRLAPYAVLIGLTSCFQPDPNVLRLDREYGFRGFTLGPQFYQDIVNQAEERATEFDVIEFETFGSRFADQHLFEQQTEVTVFGASVTNIFAGLIDQKVYALLFQVETDGAAQDALRDSLYAYYGIPQQVVDTTYLAGSTIVRNHRFTWEANRVSMELGQGDGFAEVMVYDQALMAQRTSVHEHVVRAQAEMNERVTNLTRVGAVRLNSTIPAARWRYRFRGEKTASPTSSYGAISYGYVQPFFDIRGESLFGVKMAFVNMRFEEASDSLRTLEVEYDNREGQIVGFMDMLRVMEGRLGRHAYSDTLYTIKGPYRRAFWYGDRLSVNLEEYRFRPEYPDRSDVRITFQMERATPVIPPMFASDISEADSLQIPVISAVKDTTSSD